MNNHHPIISIIIPCFNAEDYIERCLKSALKQSYPNIEIICVNDGSKDNTENIIIKHSSQHKNITLISQNNAGATEARRTALISASGEYILPLDSDDYIESDYIEKIYKSIKKHDSCIGISEVYCTSKDCTKALIIYKQDNEVITGETAFIETLSKWKLSGVGLIRQDIYSKAYDRFDKFKIRAINSDELITRIIFSLSKKVSKVKTKYYYSHDNNKSVTRKFNKNRLERLIVERCLKEIAIEKNFYKEAYKELILSSISLSNRLLKSWNKNQDILNLEDIKLCDKLCKERIDDFTLSEYFSTLLDTSIKFKTKLKIIKFLFVFKLT